MCNNNNYVNTCRSIPGAVGNLLSLSVELYEPIVSAVFSRWVNAKPNKIAKFVEYCFGKVQKLRYCVQPAIQ